MGFEPLIWYCKPQPNSIWEKIGDCAFGSYTPCAINTFVISTSNVALMYLCLYRIWLITFNAKVQRGKILLSTVYKKGKRLKNRAKTFTPFSLSQKLAAFSPLTQRPTAAFAPPAGAKFSICPCWHHVWTIWYSILEFFLATLIGKAVIEAHIQYSNVELLSSAE
ncbi:hypothetical protein P8452_18329 [Trifolium repens]|nr:hypothetical protein P8452_18329 [Trifolium repens]